MPVTKVEFVAINKGRRFVFTKHCANTKHKASHDVRPEGSSYKEAKPINAKVFDKYKKLALRNQEATV